MQIKTLLGFGGGGDMRRISVAESAKLTEMGQQLQLVNSQLAAIQASYDGGGYTHAFTLSYDGEKNQGELGPVIHYELDIPALRARGWQLYHESEVVQIVVNRTVTWAIGKGLKLIAEPKLTVLDSEKVPVTKEQLAEFSKTVQARWEVYANSKIADHSGMESLNSIHSEAMKNVLIAGDGLVVLRYEDGYVTQQLIDSAHVCTPTMGIRMEGTTPVDATTGNRIVLGVEIDKRGRHVAYHVRKAWNSYERIEARNSAGMVQAYLVYGNRFRINSVRGLPLVAAVMETAKKMERYKEATLGSAEERAKIPFTVEHEAASDGQNPFAIGKIRNAAGLNKPGDIAETVDGTVLEDKIAATYNKKVTNLPVGAKLKSLESKQELDFPGFYGANFDALCATVEIPPNVAMGKYDSNFSASRAAIKDWEHTIGVRSHRFAAQMCQPHYAMWLLVEILNNKVNAPGYLAAVNDNNRMALEAYQFSRWVGPNVPHIDPVKEVEAQRRKLGDLGAHIPLCTVADATEALGEGDSDANMELFAQELQKASGLGLSQQPPNQPPPNNDETE